MPDRHVAAVRKMDDERLEWLCLPDISKLVGGHESILSPGLSRGMIGGVRAPGPYITSGGHPLADRRKLWRLERGDHFHAFRFPEKPLRQLLKPTLPVLLQPDIRLRRGMDLLPEERQARPQLIERVELENERCDVDELHPLLDKPITRRLDWGAADGIVIWSV
jgi:hypothetical protein